MKNEKITKKKAFKPAVGSVQCPEYQTSDELGKFWARRTACEMAD